MQEKILLLIALLALGICVLAAQNNMEVLFEMVGNQNYDHLGESMAALDFNGDGYDDLAVVQCRWVPDSLDVQIGPDTYIGRDWGRVLIYYGGPDFDSVADFTIEGERPQQFRFSSRMKFYSLGDVNGDGYDDLGIYSHPNQIFVYFGGDNPSNTPGLIINPNPGTTYFYDCIFHFLGDINGDGFDDFSYGLYPQGQYYGPIRIVWGGSFAETTVGTMFDTDIFFLRGIGDINADGYDDMNYTVFHQGGGFNHLSYLYYGTERYDSHGYVLFYETTENLWFPRKALGDINSDGYADFLGRIDGTIRVWYGGDTLSEDSNLNMLPYYVGHGTSDESLVYGDLNGDGYDDIAGADPGYDWWNGQACIWLGGSNPNGTTDLYLYRHMAGMQFGLGIACGDFNADGCDDLAISEPFFHGEGSFPGRIRIFLGNPELDDTTSSSADDEVSQLGNWSIRAIPNPAPKGSDVTIRFFGSGFEKYRNLKLRIYNIRGQLVFSNYIGDKAAQGADLSIDVPALGRGVYLLCVSEAENKLKNIRFAIN